MAVTYTFSTQSGSIPLAQLDANFATPITIGNTSVQLGNTITTLNNITLANTTITGGNVTLTNVSITTANVTTANITNAVIGTANVTTANITSGVIATANITTGNVGTLTLTNALGTASGGTGLSSFTSGGVVYASSSSALTTGSSLTFDGTLLTNTVSDAGTALKLAGTTGKVRVRPYVDSTYGVVFESTNAAESAYLPMSFYGTNIYTNPDTAAIWRIGGSEQMRLTSTGLGIGTSSPGDKLVASGGIHSTGNVSSLASGQSIFMAAYTTYGRIEARDWTGAAWLPIAIAPNGGNVGIGTTSPARKLDVAATMRIADGSSVEWGGTSLYIAGTSNTLLFATSSSEKMRLDSSGNLGIGTSSPGVKLDVSDTSAQIRATSSTGTNICFGSYNNTGGSLRVGIESSSGGSLLSGSAAYSGIIGTTGAYPLAFGTSATQRMELDASGNLGIGTSSPGQKLHVAGNIRTTNSLIEDSGTNVNFGTIAAGYLAFLSGSGAERMRLDASGNLTVPAMYSTTVTTPRNVFIDSTGKMGGISSTRASKTNISQLDTASWIYELNPVTFNYLKKDEEGEYLEEFEEEQQFGLIAEEVELVKPELCIYTDDKVSGIHYDRMIAPLIKAIQELKASNDALTARIAQLEAK
jgi:hypothetical protein